MRVLCVSDIVEPALQDARAVEFLGAFDFLLSCGDLPPEYLASLARSFDAPLFFVRGNHDLRYEAKPPEGCVDLHGRLVKFQGLNLLGLEGSFWYNGGPQQYTESQMRAIIRRLRFSLWWRGGIDIVITHAPPRHIHDAEDRCHRGFESFRRLIDRYQPRYFIHGHIHANYTDPAQRVARRNRTQVINSYGHFLLEIDAPRVAG